MKKNDDDNDNNNNKKKFLTPKLLNVYTSCFMNDLTGVSWQVTPWNLHTVSYLVGAVIVWSNTWGHQPVFYSQNTAVSFDVQGDVFWVETCGQARQHDVCLDLSVFCKHVHLRWSWKNKSHGEFTVAGWLHISTLQTTIIRHTITELYATDVIINWIILLQIIFCSDFNIICLLLHIQEVGIL